MPKITYLVPVVLLLFVLGYFGYNSYLLLRVGGYGKTDAQQKKRWMTSIVFAILAVLAAICGSQAMALYGRGGVVSVDAYHVARYMVYRMFSMTIRLGFLFYCGWNLYVFVKMRGPANMSSKQKKHLFACIVLLFVLGVIGAEYRYIMRLHFHPNQPSPSFSAYLGYFIELVQRHSIGLLIQLYVLWCIFNLIKMGSYKNLESGQKKHVIACAILVGVGIVVWPFVPMWGHMGNNPGFPLPSTTMLFITVATAVKFGLIIGLIAFLGWAIFALIKAGNFANLPNNKQKSLFIIASIVFLPLAYTWWIWVHGYTGLGSLINILCYFFFMLFVPVYCVGVLVCCIQNLIVLFGPKGPRGMSISEQQYSVACLFFVLLPVVLYVYEPAGVGLFFASMIFWFVLRQVQQSSMFAGKTFLPAACVLLLCMGGALFIPPVVHPWNARKEAADMDYRAMEAIFQGKLPASFKIVKTHYPGFSRIFNGPDGPGEPYYLVTVEKQEYAELMSRVKKEEIPSSDFQRHAHSPMRMATAFDLDPIKDHLDKMRMYTLPKTTVVVDEISTPTRLYISTIVPYTKDVRDGFKASGLAK